MRNPFSQKPVEQPKTFVLDTWVASRSIGRKELHGIVVGNGARFDILSKGRLFMPIIFFRASTPNRNVMDNVVYQLYNLKRAGVEVGMLNVEERDA